MFFPTIEDYVRAFEDFADATPKGGVLIFNEDDDIATVIGRKEREDVFPVGIRNPPSQDRGREKPS